MPRIETPCDRIGGDAELPRHALEMRLHQLLVCLAIWTVGSLAASEHAVAEFYGRHASSSGHTNNWAVLVCASRYWFNYRVCRGIVQ